MAIRFDKATARVGAYVTGVDLRKELSDAEIATIYQGLLDHGVVFFRGQHITDEEHLRFALRFGTLSVPPLKARKDTGDPVADSVHVLNQTSPKGEGGDNWHADNTFMPHPPMGSMLRAITLPPVGGDTLWASAYAAYDDLSPQLKDLAENLVGIHDITPGAMKAIAKGHALDLERLRRDWPPVEHPVVRVHAETGRKLLYVNRSSVTRLKGLSPWENEALLPLLCDQVRHPEFQVRLTWEPGTMAFWDNRAVQHYAVPDYTERREMHRVTVDFARGFTD
ncbi:taurine dioxygenase [Nocardiopsis gilva YIM 90087]|uniref:Taurine dioxygenase n=1 Tax=Nocardiopsis gilva YIM 90087 TaxID=1235441 RepID=A0A223S2M1_9ACTN|nr:TauD/TfdA family dioxygenase [Nocardiopsis gilva]ASU82368.1 taurine dioxygenase [Nocardiopsis gilva YIM 90087]